MIVVEHAGQDARDNEVYDDNDGGEAVVNGDLADLPVKSSTDAVVDDSHPSSLMVPATVAGEEVAVSGLTVPREYLRSLRDLMDLEEFSSRLHRSETADTSHSPSIRRGGDIGRISSSVIIEPFDTSALTKRAAQYAEAIRREQSGMLTSEAANNVLSRWTRVVAVVDFDAASAAHMTPTDSAVSSVDVLVDLCETLQFSAVKEFSLPSTNTEFVYQKTLINSADVREARRKDREGARRDRTSKRTALLSVDRFDEVEAFVDSRAILGDMLSEYGAPWTNHGGPRDSSSPNEGFSSFPTVGEIIDDEPTTSAMRTPHDRQQRTLQKLVWLSCEQARNRWRTL
jgi:hypothetical protein